MKLIFFFLFELHVLVPSYARWEAGGGHFSASFFHPPANKGGWKRVPFRHLLCNTQPASVGARPL